MLLARDSKCRVVKLRGPDIEVCREGLTAALTAKIPKRTLTGNQRSSLLASFTSKSLASGPVCIYSIYVYIYVCKLRERERENKRDRVSGRKRVTGVVYE